MSFPRQSPSPQIPPNQQILGSQSHPQILGPALSGQGPPLPLRPKPFPSSASSSTLAQTARTWTGVPEAETGLKAGPVDPRLQPSLCNCRRPSLDPLVFMGFFDSSGRNEDRPPEGYTLRWAEGGKSLGVYLKQEVPPPLKSRLLEDGNY